MTGRFFLSLLTVFFLTGCRPFSPYSVTKFINPMQWEKRQSTVSVPLLDVRTLKEYEAGHLTQALHVDWQDSSFVKKVRVFDPNQPILIYCMSGRRSKAAAETMRALGFKQVWQLRGGINAWKAAGLKLEGASPAALP